MTVDYPLFDRDFEITVGNILIPARAIDPKTNKIQPTLKVSFAIDKTDDASTNKAKLTIYNLNPDHRSAVQEGWPVTIQAGYVANTTQLFGGWIEKADNNLTGVNWLTTIEVDDGAKMIRTARVKLSLGKGSSLVSLLTAVANELGLGLGNSVQKFAASRRGLTAFKKGVAVSGTASKVLDKYIASAGYQWSIQDGILQVLGVDETTTESVPILNPASGLVGSPERGEKGSIKATSLLNGAIKAGGRVGFKSAALDGYYKVKKLTHIGDTWGSDWFTKFEGTPVT